MMTHLYDILTINPVTFRGGAIWQVVSTIYDSILGGALSLAIMLFYIGIISDLGDLIKHKNYETIIWSFIKLLCQTGVLIYGRYLMIWIFSIGKEFIDAIVLKSGAGAIDAAKWVSLPDNITNATNGLSMSTGIVFWVVTLLAALVIMVVSFTIMLTIYGRIFKIYLHIAIAPLPLACFSSRATMQQFQTFVKSFVGVILEGVIILVACVIFSAFASNFDINNPIQNTSAETGVEGDVGLGINANVDNSGLSITDSVSNVLGTSETSGENAEMVWTYLGETLFLFILMAGVVKGADDTVRRMIGV